jgi:hypothetical protein
MNRINNMMGKICRTIAETRFFVSEPFSGGVMDMIYALQNDEKYHFKYVGAIFVDFKPTGIRVLDNLDTLKHILYNDLLLRTDEGKKFIVIYDEQKHIAYTA